MKKIILSVCLVCAVLSMTACQATQEKKETPYDRRAAIDEHERIFRRYIFASCVNSDQFYATYALAHLDAKPTQKDSRYKVTFVNGPCKGKTIRTNDVILKTSSVGGGQLPKGTVVLRNYNNPRQLSTETDELASWHRAVVYDTSRLDQGIVELEFPRDRNDFMAPREFIYVQNIRYIDEPEQKDIRTWL